MKYQYVYILIYQLKFLIYCNNIFRKGVIIFFFFIYDEETDTTVSEETDFENDEELDFFFDDKVRKIWHRQQEEWYFSIVDVCQVLTDSLNPKNYWNMLKSRLRTEGNETYTNCVRLKMKAADGKMRKTDCANITQILRIIQSIPSKKAEPFKLWLAEVGKECLDEIADPELAFERMIRTYRDKGYSENWIEKRLEAIDHRKKLTAAWNEAGIKSGQHYAMLTDTLTHEWSGKHIKEYKQFKGLHKENLRDNMTDIELALNQLAEVSSTLIANVQKPNGFSETKKTVIDGGAIAGNARKELENKLGKSVISPFNASDPKLLDNNEP